MENTEQRERQPLENSLNHLINLLYDLSECKKTLKHYQKTIGSEELFSAIASIKEKQKVLKSALKEKEEMLKYEQDNDPKIKEIKHKILEIEENIADSKATIREVGVKELEKTPVKQLELFDDSGNPKKVAIMRALLLSINGKEEFI